MGAIMAMVLLVTTRAWELPVSRFGRACYAAALIIALLTVGLAIHFRDPVQALSSAGGACVLLFVLIRSRHHAPG
jgi:hypothetical protein